MQDSGVVIYIKTGLMSRIEISETVRCQCALLLRTEDDNYFNKGLTLFKKSGYDINFSLIYDFDGDFLGISRLYTDDLLCLDCRAYYEHNYKDVGCVKCGRGGILCLKCVPKQTKKFNFYKIKGNINFKFF